MVNRVFSVLIVGGLCLMLLCSCFGDDKTNASSSASSNVIVNDGGSYSSRDMELSVPDDWKKPVEDNYNSMPDKEYKPDFPEYEPAEGDTGQTGEDWEWPEWGGDGVSGEINGYKDFNTGGK